MNDQGAMPAYPCSDAIRHDFETGGHGSIGLTKREVFAMEVDVSAYSPYQTWCNKHGAPPTVDQLAEYIASIRIIEADALLAALEKSP